MRHQSSDYHGFTPQIASRHLALTALSIVVILLINFALSERIGLISAAVVSLLLGAICDFICRKLWCAGAYQTPAVEQKLLQDLKAERDVLLAVIEASPFRIALYDPADVLVTSSRSYRESYAGIWAKLPKPVHYRALISASLEAINFKGDRQAEIDLRVARQRDGDSSQKDRLYPDGSWLRVAKIKLDDGHIAGFATDITELLQREEKLKAVNGQLAMMVNERLPHAVKGLSSLSSRLVSPMPRQKLRL
jgi:hypothetical protein